MEGGREGGGEGGGREGRKEGIGHFHKDLKLLPHHITEDLGTDHHSQYSTHQHSAGFHTGFVGVCVGGGGGGGTATVSLCN